MDSTANFGLHLPAENDYAQIGPINENFEKLDEEVFAREALLRSAAAKNILAALDKLPVVDSEDGNKTKLITLQLLQKMLAAAFNQAYAALGHSHAWGEITGVPGAFTPAAHTHPKSQITDFPSSMPASDVYAWAKAASKPAYAWSEITGKPSTFAPAAHNHAAGDINSGTLGVARGGTGVTSMAALATQLMGQGMCKIATGSYVGTGTYGVNNPCSLTFDFPPKLVMVLGPSANSNGVANSSPLYCCATFACEALQSTYQERGYVSFDVVSGGGANAYAKLSGNTLSWYSVSARYQLNARATNYYICIG